MAARNDDDKNDLNADPSDPDYAAGAGTRDSARECQELCQKRAECNFFTYVKSYYGACFLKTSDSGRRAFSGAVSGTKFCGKYMYFMIVKIAKKLI